MTNPVIQALLDRRSVRAYTEESVPKELLDVLINCAFNAPSAMNAQPWHLTVVQDRAWLEDIDQAIQEAVIGNDPTQMLDANKKYLYRAPVAIFISSKDGKGAVDIGMLTQNICIAAHSLGLGSCVIGMVNMALNGSDGTKYLSYLRLPVGYKAHYAVILGYPAQTPDAKPRDVSKITWR